MRVARTRDTYELFNILQVLLFTRSAYEVKYFIEVDVKMKLAPDGHKSNAVYFEGSLKFNYKSFHDCMVKIQGHVVILCVPHLSSLAYQTAVNLIAFTIFCKKKCEL